MLYVQLGPIIASFYDYLPAAISLARAIFSDFDLDDVMDNSSGYLNTILFLIYLFVSIFVMLTLFLAILFEGFMKVRGTSLESPFPSRRLVHEWRWACGRVGQSGASLFPWWMMALWMTALPPWLRAAPPPVCTGENGLRGGQG